MASTTKSRWADDEESTEAAAQRKREKEERRRLREEKIRRQQEATEAAARAQQTTDSSANNDDGPPTKRRRTSNDQNGSPNAGQEGAHILLFPIRTFNASRSVSLYEQLNNIEEGSYGFVSRARVRSTGEIVALKRLKTDNNTISEGFPVTGLREIQTLKACDHPHIVHLREVVVGDLNNYNAQDKSLPVHLVLDFVEHDLKTLLQSNPEPFLPSETKTLVLQTTSALAYLHANHILHRDLKTSNLLLNNRGEIKLADFGMARYTCSPPPRNLTQLVVTLWYRAPELLLGTTSYAGEIDVWSLGCVFAELLTNDPLFQGTNEVDQLTRIFTLLGPPTATSWPGFRALPNAKALHPLLSKSNQTAASVVVTPWARFPHLTAAGRALLDALLSVDPARRPTPETVLDHPYFREDPRPKPKEMFPTFPSKAGQERRRRRETPDAPGRGAAVVEMRPEDFAGVLDQAPPEGRVQGGSGFALRLG